MIDWKSAVCPPESEHGQWSLPVIGVTNTGNVFRVSFMAGSSGGVWQRPAAMDDGEQIVKWTEFPDD